MADRGAVAPYTGLVVAEKYRIEELIGEGGMGAVYAASHEITGKKVALKWLIGDHAGDQASERFLREAQAAGRIRHPNVVDIYDVGSFEGAPYIVMEYLEGESLADRLERAPASPAEIIEWLLPALRGLAVAHRAGVIHRDLKPDNIFLSSNEGEEKSIAKLLDFGISKVVDGTSVKLTQSGTILGTPYYMSPEQIRGQRDIDERTDVYSMGVILYECMSGRVPFGGETYGAVAIAVATAPIIPLGDLRPGLPPGLDAVILKAMHRDRDARYASVDALIEALKPFSAALDNSGERPVLSGVSSISAQVREATGPYGHANEANSGAFTDHNRREERTIPAWLLAGIGALVVLLVGGGLVALLWVLRPETPALDLGFDESVTTVIEDIPTQQAEREIESAAKPNSDEERPVAEEAAAVGAADPPEETAPPAPETPKATEKPTKAVESASATRMSTGSSSSSMVRRSSSRRTQSAQAKTRAGTIKIDDF